jgi:peptide-methionine (R)-S-oxide reductase
LDKSRPRRYSSAQLLREDLERFLDDRPILARPVTSIEKAWRWCHRNPIVAGLAMLVSVLVLGTATLSSIAYLREAALRDDLFYEVELRKNLNANVSEMKSKEHAKIINQKLDKAINDRKERARLKKELMELSNRPEQQTSTEDLLERSVNSGRKYNKLTGEEQHVILRQGTEPAYRGKYTYHDAEGCYICKRCNAPLFDSTHKFESGCGWPCFDDAISNAMNWSIDGTRMRIHCNNCGGHLGHQYQGERFTSKNVRNCVNSISLTFIPKGKDKPNVVLLGEIEITEGKP